MNYFTRIGDRLVFRLINYGILLHASFCIAAISVVFGAPMLIADFIGDIKLANIIFKEAQVVSVPLVNRTQERGDARTGKFLYYVELPRSETSADTFSISIATPYLRSQQVGDLEALQIYSHPLLINTPNVSDRIVEATEERTWSSVFQALRGRSINSAVAILFLQLLLGITVIYVAVRGYFFIKYGPRKRRFSA